MNGRNVKELIQRAAREQGFHRVTIGSLEPLGEAREEYKKWLENGFAAGMEYLKRNPDARTDPSMLFPGSLSAIIVAISYYSEPPAQPPYPVSGRVARYAVGLDYHAVIRARLRTLRSSIEAEIGRPLLGKVYTDDVALHEQSFAARHGIGFVGRNTLVIGPKLSGSYYFLAELFCDLEIEPDEPYQGTCGNCFRCGNACPTKAITPDGMVDANLCISYLTIENKGGIPVELRPLLGNWVFGCDICQEVCPYNQRPPESVWEEFRPAKGAGHHLDLLSILAIRDEDEFRQKFGHTPLRRPKRRGLIRNALVVIGNYFRESRNSSTISDEQWRWIRETTDRLESFVEADGDGMLREHAVWALTQSPVMSRSKVTQIIAGETDAGNLETMESHILKMS